MLTQEEIDVRLAKIASSRNDTPFCQKCNEPFGDKTQIGLSESSFNDYSIICGKRGHTAHCVIIDLKPIISK